MKAVVYFGLDNTNHEDIYEQKPRESFEEIIRLTTPSHLWHKFDHGEKRYN